MAQTHDVTCALSSVQLQGGKPSVKLQTHGLNESAEAKRDSMHLASFSTKFTFMINSLHIACVTWPFLLSLAFAIVCVLLQFYSKGHLIQVSPSRHNCEQRWKRWGGLYLGWRESRSGLDLAPSFPFLCTTLHIRAQTHRLEAAVPRSEGFHSCAAPELCVIQKVSKTTVILLSQTSFSTSVLLSITVLCHNKWQGSLVKHKKEKKISEHLNSLNT